MTMPTTHSSVDRLVPGGPHHGADSFTREATDPDCISPEAAADLLWGTPWRRFVVMGDSVASGVREPLDGYRDLAAHDRLAEALRADGRTLVHHNLGVRDLRAAEIAASQLEPALRLDPDLVVVSAGGNDAMRRRFDARTFAAELAGLVRPLAAAGATVVLVGLFDLARSGLQPPDEAPAMAQRFDLLDAVTARVAADEGCLFADNHRHPRGSDPAIYASDRIHCNARGHAIAAATLIRLLGGPPCGGPGESTRVPGGPADSLRGWRPWPF